MNPNINSTEIAHDIAKAREAWDQTGSVIARGNAAILNTRDTRRIFDQICFDFSDRSSELIVRAKINGPLDKKLYFLTDHPGEKPQIQSGRSSEIVDIVSAPALMEKIEGITGLSDISCRTIRYFEMAAGGRYDAHRDNQENPDLELSLVLGMNDAETDRYEGGETVCFSNISTYINDLDHGVRHQLYQGDALLIPSSELHLVEPVLSGTKRSLVLFGSSSQRENPRRRFASASAAMARMQEEYATLATSD